jgi:hypothetical protein
MASVLTVDGLFRDGHIVCPARSIAKMTLLLSQCAAELIFSVHPPNSQNQVILTVEAATRSQREEEPTVPLSGFLRRVSFAWRRPSGKQNVGRLFVNENKELDFSADDSTGFALAGLIAASFDIDALLNGKNAAPKTYDGPPLLADCEWLAAFRGSRKARNDRLVEKQKAGFHASLAAKRVFAYGKKRADALQCVVRAQADRARARALVGGRVVRCKQAHHAPVVEHQEGFVFNAEIDKAGQIVVDVLFVDETMARDVPLSTARTWLEYADVMPPAFFEQVAAREDAAVSSLAALRVLDEAGRFGPKKPSPRPERPLRFMSKFDSDAALVVADSLVMYPTRTAPPKTARPGSRGVQGALQTCNCGAWERWEDRQRVQTGKHNRVRHLGYCAAKM